VARMFGVVGRFWFGKRLRVARIRGRSGFHAEIIPVNENVRCVEHNGRFQKEGAKLNHLLDFEAV
jgi:hypothetical protein